MPSDRFFSYAERLLSYSGALQARALREKTSAQEDSASSRPAAVSNGAVRRPTGTAEYDDSGNRIENGVAVDERGVPLWIKKKATEEGHGGEIDVIPGNAAALAFSPAFSGQFSYAQVKKTEGVSDD